MVRCKDYRAGMEIPLLAKLKLFGLKEPEYITASTTRSGYTHKYKWLPFSEMTYRSRRSRWYEFNVEVNRLLRDNGYEGQ